MLSNEAWLPVSIPVHPKGGLLRSGQCADRSRPNLATRFLTDLTLSMGALLEAHGCVDQANSTNAQNIWKGLHCFCVRHVKHVSLVLHTRIPVIFQLH